MIKIAITGPESTGKTTLAEALADHYQVIWAHEFARDYLNERKGKYSIKDLDTIALGQQKNIDSLRNMDVLITDTELTVIKIWSEFKYGECSNFINTLWKEQHFDLYLLCATDIPYEHDPLREHEEFREELFEIYLNVLTQMRVNFVVVEGDVQTRLNTAVSLVEELLEENLHS